MDEKQSKNLQGDSQIVSAMEASISSVEGDIRNATAFINDTNDIVKALSKKNDEYKAAYEKLMTRYRESEDNAKELYDGLLKTMQEKMDADERITELEAANAQLDKDNKSFAEASKKEKEELSNKLSAVTEESKKTRLDLDKLTKEASGLSARNEDLMNQLNTANADKATLEQDKKVLSNEKKTLTDNNDTLSAQIGQANVKIRELETKNNGQLVQLNAANEQCERLNMELEKERTANRQLSEQLNTANDKCGKLEADLNKERTEKLRLEKELNDKKGRYKVGFRSLEGKLLEQKQRLEEESRRRIGEKLDCPDDKPKGYTLQNALIAAQRSAGSRTGAANAAGNKTGAANVAGIKQ